MDKRDIMNLKKRYLIWLYKTAKEAFDKIERKFTQLEVDRLILKELEKANKDKKAQKFVDEFKAYVNNKEKEGTELKYEGKELKPQYTFLAAKLEAVEKIITKLLGKEALEEIKLLYEMEMTERIMKSRDH